MGGAKINTIKRYILTGAPGSGKTTIIKTLMEKGCSVVAEAATDVIADEQKRGAAEPWTKPDFIDKILNLQNERQRGASGDPQFYDRSPICTYALAKYLGFEPSTDLLQTIEHMKGVYEPPVFFIDNLGFVEHTDARKISFEEALKFENIHREAYARFGFQCIHIPPASIEERIAQILGMM